MVTDSFAATPNGGFTNKMQAVLHAGRERSRSLRGVPDLFRSRMETPANDLAGIPLSVANSPMLLTGTIRLTDANYVGSLFSFGQTSGAVIAVGITTGQVLTSVVGSGVNLAETEYSMVSGVGAELDVALVINPGAGFHETYLNGQRVARSTPVDPQFGGTTVSNEDGAYGFPTTQLIIGDAAAAANTPLFGVEVVASLSIYYNQKPRHTGLVNEGLS